MSRPREVREAQRHSPKREAWVDAAFDALDGEDEELPDPYHNDTYHTMPGIPNFRGMAQPKMRRKES